jgi:hypothetical protein
MLLISILIDDLPESDLDPIAKLSLLDEISGQSIIIAIDSREFVGLEVILVADCGGHGTGVVNGGLGHIQIIHCALYLWESV